MVDLMAGTLIIQRIPYLLCLDHARRIERALKLKDQLTGRA